ncbi:hypothetical protein [Olleya sp. R77988]|uniref:hypothetical protein n=1 Tax=Olleya sp. R77988 TaxID=3093875 RepID=UPI0037C7DC0E
MKQLFTLFNLLASIMLYSQEFEGTVTYKMDYTIKSSELDLQELKKLMGTEAKTHFKDGFYLEKTDSDFMSYQLYSPKDTLVYYKNNIKSDTIKYNRVNTKTEEEFTYKIEKNTDTILGYKCDKLIFKDKYGIKTYYYSSELSLDPEDYKFFLVSNKNKIVSLMKAIYLRLEMTFPAFTVDIIATEVKHTQLKKSLFKLPKDHNLIDGNF